MRKPRERRSLTSEIHPSVLARIAEQLGTDNGAIADAAWQGRTGKRHRAEIRVLFGFREPTVADAEEMAAWLRDHAVAHSGDPEHLATALKAHCRSSLDRTADARPHRHELLGRLWRQLVEHKSRDTDCLT